MPYVSTGKILDVDIDAIRLSGGLSAGAGIPAFTNSVTGQNSGAQATAKARATIALAEANGKAAAVFDVVDDYYDFGNIFNSLTEFTVYALMKVPVGTTGFWTTKAGQLDPINDTQIIFADTYYEGLGGTTRPAIGVTPFSASVYKLLTIVSKANDYRIYVDGTQIYSAASNTVGFNTAAGFLFGKTERPDYFGGKLLRLLAYSNGHTAADVTTNKNQFAADYQLTNLGYAPPPKILDVDIDAIRLSGGLGAGAAIPALTNSISGQNSGTQATAGERATVALSEANGKAAADFAGSKFYDFGTIFNALTEFTVYALMKVPSGTTGFWTTKAGQLDPINNTQIIFGDTYYEGLGATTRVLIGVTPFSAGIYKLLTIVSKANDYRIYVDGTQIYSSATNTVGFNTLAGFLFGKTERPDYFGGKLLRLLAYSNGHTAADVTAHKNQFATDYQLTNLGYVVPVAAFTKSAASGTAPLFVSFTDASSGSPTAWAWNFGDGTTSTAQHPTKTFTAPGTFTVSLTVTNPHGSSSTSQFVSTVAPPVPTSVWSKMQVVPLGGLEAWNALDLATGGNQVGDFSRKQRTLSAGANPPVLEANKLNGYPGIYFDGTKNPLSYSGSLTLRHAFIVASYADATFPAATAGGYAGLLSDLSANAILVGNPLEARFFNSNFSASGSYSYRKNYVPFAEAAQAAPVSGNAGIIEIIYAPGFNMNGIQIGQDRADTTRRWKGHFFELLAYSTVKTEHERRHIYSYLAMKFRLWRQAASGLYIFPFPNNYKSPGQTFTTNLESTSISGAYKGRSKSGLMRSFEVPFTSRRQEEWDAAEAFWMQHRHNCVLDDCSFYPSRQFTGRITTPIERDPQTLNSNGYKFGFVTKVGLSGFFTETTAVIGGGGA